MAGSAHRAKSVSRETSRINQEGSSGRTLVSSSCEVHSLSQNRLSMTSKAPTQSEKSALADHRDVPHERVPAFITQSSRSSTPRTQTGLLRICPHASGETRHKCNARRIRCQHAARQHSPEQNGANSRGSKPRVEGWPAKQSNWHPAPRRAHLRRQYTRRSGLVASELSQPFG